MNEPEMTPSDAVRRRAEAFAAQIREDPDALSADAVRQLLHELRVHQIELELQNEELRRTQVELEASRARYFGLYDLAPVGYVTISEQATILEANLTLADLLELTRKELAQRPFTFFILPADQDIFYQHRRKLFASGRPQACELRLLRASGDTFWVRLDSIRAQSADGTPTGRVIISDITTRKQAEEALQKSHGRLEKTLDELNKTQAQLVQQERLVAVGQLAAGIAHDFNNILAVITLYIDMSLNAPDLSPQLHKHLKTIGHQTGRATHLVQQILDFSRRTVMKTRSLDLVLFLQEQIALWRHTIPESIKIYLHDETAGECVIRGDPTRLQQLFTNLVLNARDAMPDGGALRLRLKLLRLAQQDTTPLPDMTPGDWVQITVSDTGTGIPAETLQYIFEPFFTTKEPGMGSGLGLGQVYGIVKQHEGTIDVQTTEGQGTVFTIYLPARVTTSLNATAATKPALRRGHGETILVVEDNEALREALESTLVMLNYQVLTATDGHEALAIVERHGVDSARASDDGEEAAPGQNIALVLSDLVMPGMDGKALFKMLRQRGLTVPVVIMSGHPMQSELSALETQGLAASLVKPVGTEELASTVAKALIRAH